MTLKSVPAVLFFLALLTACAPPISATITQHELVLVRDVDGRLWGFPTAGVESVDGNQVVLRPETRVVTVMPGEGRATEDWIIERLRDVSAPGNLVVSSLPHGSFVIEAGMTNNSQPLEVVKVIAARGCDFELGSFLQGGCQGGT